MRESTPISDFADRLRVLDPLHSFIVQAPAGSGKTELLIQRYLALLARVTAPEEIIAITFTNKAATVMRERVLKALSSTNEIPKTDHEKLTQDLVEAVLQRDSQAGWHIINNPTRLRIQTIDSLCASLVRQMPILSRFGSQPEIIKNASNLYLQAARATIELVESDPATAKDIRCLLEHLDNDVIKIEKLLADMLSRRDQWLRYIYYKDRNRLETTLKNIRREAMSQLLSIYPLSTQDELIKIIHYAANNLIADCKDSPLITCKDLNLLPGNEEHDVSLWYGIAELLLTKDGVWRKQYNRNNGFPAGKNKTEKEVAKTWKSRVFALSAILMERDALSQTLHDIRFLPPPTYTDAQWRVLGSIVRLLPIVVGQMKLVFQSYGQVDFTEVAQSALRALGEINAPTDLALTLDYKIQHLLVDEFQDTSISQYELITKLTAGWELGDGRSLFLVGDPMQSIYRFREAEVGLFLRARAEGIGNIVLQPIYLRTNFRSQHGIVDWINNTFEKIMPRNENISTGAVPYTASISIHKKLIDAAVTVHPFFNDDHMAEAEKVIEIIMHVQRENPLSTIAILVRNRAHLYKIIPRIREMKLRFRAIEIEKLDCQPVIQDLLVLTRALTHLADKLAWLAVLRAPWCGLILSDLHAIVSMKTVYSSNVVNSGEENTEENEKTIWELLNSEAVMTGVSIDGITRLLRVREVLSNCIDNRYRQSLRITIEKAWIALGGPACIKNVTDLGNAAIYFDHLETHERTANTYDIEVFEKELAELYALPDLEENGTLQIMTIHKAKGLEFDCVIMPGIDRLSRVKTKKLLAWMERSHAQSLVDGNARNIDLLLAPIQQIGSDGDSIYAFLEKLDAEKEDLEDGRLLYVAATRAKRFLHLLGNTSLNANQDGVIELRPPIRRSLLSKLWPVIENIYVEAASKIMFSDTFLTANRKKNEELDGPQSSQLLCRLVSNWEMPMVPQQMEWHSLKKIVGTQNEIEFSWAGETARHIGSVVHRWLQRIAEDKIIGWNVSQIKALHDTFRKNLIACGMSNNGRDIETAITRVTTALTYTVEDSLGRWILGPQQDSHNELCITTVIDTEYVNLIIDRTFFSTDGFRWIIDYKTSSHEGPDIEKFLDHEQGRYRDQLDRYAKVMRTIYDQPVRLGLYFPLLKGWREWGDKK